MKTASPWLVIGLLLTVFFTVGTSLEVRVNAAPNSKSADGAFKKLLGEGRRLFAGQFVEMADVYLHSGYYPSIFDRRDAQAPKAISGGATEPDEHEHEGHQHDEGGEAAHEDEHEKAMQFRDQPRDWLDGFIRHFRITQHTHLSKGEEREVIPWLKVAIELDPQNVGTYVATAYWLRKELGKAKDAERVLREGIRNNPNSAELLFEMGLLQQENYQDTDRARNLWTLALRRWDAQTAEVKAGSSDVLGRITIHLARLEEAAGNWSQAIRYLELTKQVSPSPGALQKQIDEIRANHGSPAKAIPPIVP